MKGFKNRVLAALTVAIICTLGLSMLTLSACGGGSQDEGTQKDQSSQSGQSAPQQSSAQEEEAEEVDPYVGTWKAFGIEDETQRVLFEDYADDPDIQEMATFTVVIGKDGSFTVSFMDGDEPFEDTGTMERQGDIILVTTTNTTFELSYSKPDDVLKVNADGAYMLLKRV